MNLQSYKKQNDAAIKKLKQDLNVTTGLAMLLNSIGAAGTVANYVGGDMSATALWAGATAIFGASSYVVMRELQCRARDIGYLEYGELCDGQLAYNVMNQEDTPRLSDRGEQGKKLKSNLKNFPIMSTIAQVLCTAVATKGIFDLIDGSNLLGGSTLVAGALLMACNAKLIHDQNKSIENLALLDTRYYDTELMGKIIEETESKLDKKSANNEDERSL